MFKNALLCANHLLVLVLLGVKVGQRDTNILKNLKNIKSYMTFEPFM